MVNEELVQTFEPVSPVIYIIKMHGIVQHVSLGRQSSVVTGCSLGNIVESADTNDAELGPLCRRACPATFPLLLVQEKERVLVITTSFLTWERTAMTSFVCGCKCSPLTEASNYISYLLQSHGSPGWWKHEGAKVDSVGGLSTGSSSDGITYSSYDIF